MAPRKPVRDKLIGDSMLLTPRQVARLWGLELADLNAMARDGTGPEFVVICGNRRYPFAAIRRWVESRKRVKGGAW